MISVPDQVRCAAAVASSLRQVWIIVHSPSASGKGSSYL